MIDGYYGEAPVSLGEMDFPDWHEFCHYLYLPVRAPLSDGHLPGGVQHSGSDFERNAPVRLPERLRFLWRLVEWAKADAATYASHLVDPYVYLSVRRGFATPGNPLNRPGWHCDDHAGTDLNYIWADRWPTRFVVTHDGLPLPIPPDDRESMVAMTNIAESAQRATDEWARVRQFNGNAPHPRLTIEHATPGHLVRLTPYVIHDTPIIPAPGGMRSFVKVSVSDHRYNLLGNSHNYLLDYAWPMYSREETRNHGSNRDYVPDAEDTMGGQG